MAKAAAVFHWQNHGHRTNKNGFRPFIMTVSYKLRCLMIMKKAGPLFYQIHLNEIHFNLLQFCHHILLWDSSNFVSLEILISFKPLHVFNSTTSWSELKLPKIESHRLSNNMCCNKYIYYSWIGPGTILQHTSSLNSLNYCSRSLTKWETHMITRFNIHLIFSKQDSDQEY